MIRCEMNMQYSAYPSTLLQPTCTFEQEKLGIVACDLDRDRDHVFARFRAFHGNARDGTRSSC